MRFPKHWILVLVALVAMTSCLILPPLRQPVEYHQFADARSWLGIPNFQNVASNVPFLLVGVFGLRQWWLSKRNQVANPSWGLGLFFVGVGFTMPGSAYYHWNPTHQTLVWDRLPMAISFMGLLSEVISRRVSAIWGARLVLPLQAAGAGSVAYWAWSFRNGTENLWPYAMVQFASILLIILMLALYPRRSSAEKHIVFAVAWYAGAKVLEHFDREVFYAGSLVSGHALKHLFAAASALHVARMISEERRAHSR